MSTSAKLAALLLSITPLAGCHGTDANNPALMALDSAGNPFPVPQPEATKSQIINDGQTAQDTAHEELRQKFKSYLVACLMQNNYPALSQMTFRYGFLRLPLENTEREKAYADLNVFSLDTDADMKTIKAAGVEIVNEAHSVSGPQYTVRYSQTFLIKGPMPRKSNWTVTSEPTEKQVVDFSNPEKGGMGYRGLNALSPLVGKTGFADTASKKALMSSCTAAAAVFDPAYAAKAASIKSELLDGWKQNPVFSR